MIPAGGSCPAPTRGTDAAGDRKGRPYAEASVTRRPGGETFRPVPEKPRDAGPGAMAHLALFLKRKLRKRITFITRKKATKTQKVRIGFVMARVASSISGKPKTMAGIKRSYAVAR